MSQAIKHISKTQATVDELQFAHRFTLKKAPITEDEWSEMMYNYGIRYALIFSGIFSNNAEKINDLLIATPPAKGDKHNWFWMWWKIKWMQDDYNYISQKVWQQPIQYSHYKCYMINCEILEQDLLNLLLSQYGEAAIYSSL